MIQTRSGKILEARVSVAPASRSLPPFVVAKDDGVEKP